MSDSHFIKKRQKARARTFLTVRIILGLVLLSGLIAAGFYLEYGGVGDAACTGECESQFSLTAWILGFFMIFLGVIAAGALVGGLFAILRWSRGRKDDTLSSFTGETPDDEA